MLSARPKLRLPLLCLTWIGLTPLACDSGPSVAPEPPAVPEASPPQEDTSSLAFSEDPVVNEIVRLGREDSQVDEPLRVLTKEIGPRLTSSHPLMEAEKWCKEQFQSWGLEARLEQWGEFPVGFDRGPWWGKAYAPATGEGGGEVTELDFITRSWTPGIQGPHRAQLIAFPESLKELKALLKSSGGAGDEKLKDEAKGGPLEGLWLLRPRWSEGEGPKEKELAKIEAALKEAKIAGEIHRSRDRGGELVHTSGDWKIDWEDLPTKVEVLLRGDQWDALAKQVESGSKVELEFSIDNRFFRGPVPQHNVIADLPGSDKADEIVIVGGHIDSWDGALGAVDNGTGVSTTMEAARLLAAAGAQPRRTIRFMLWGGEEQGLFGSKGYVDQHPELMDKISVVLVHDGGTNYLSGLAVTPEMAPQMKEVFEPVFRLDERYPFALTLSPSLQTGGSDHTPFIRAGVPGFFWNQDGEADYRHAHHTQYDTLEAVVPEYQQHSAMVVALAAWNFANSESMVDRTDSAPLARREMGVELGEDYRIEKVAKNSAASKAGWQKGDQIVSIEGQVLGEAGWRAFRAMQGGEPTKGVVIRRGKKEMETILDWSESKAEKDSAARRARRKEKFGELEWGSVIAGTRPEPEPATGKAN